MASSMLEYDMLMNRNMVDALLCSVKALRVDLCTNLVYHQDLR